MTSNQFSKTSGRAERLSRVFLDQDGTLCEFRFDCTLEDLYVPGYFEALKPHDNIISACQRLVNEENELFLLSAVLKDHKTAVSEKSSWGDNYVPFIQNRLFPYCGEKKNAVLEFFYPDDILIDDFGKNLSEWHGIRIKVSRNKEDKVKESRRWEYVISPDDEPEEIIEVIKRAKREIVFLLY